MDTFSGHVAKKVAIYTEALTAAKIDSVIIYAGDLVYPFNDDLDYPFRCNPYFAEWLPVQDFPGSLIFFSPGERPKLLLPIIDGYWDSPPASVPDWVAAEFELTWYRDVMEVPRVLPVNQKVAWIGPDSMSLTSKIAAITNPPAVINFIDYHRAFKTGYEVECLEAATALAFRGHEAAEQAFLDGRSELDIHLAYLSATKIADDELPYRSIVALNEHASTLHHMMRSKEVPAASKALLIDAGAQAKGYACDISRTHVSNDERKSRFVELRDAMDAGQKKLVAAVGPGVCFGELHERAHQMITEILVEHDIVRASPEQAWDMNVSAPFFPHGLGHLLGIQVHDRGGYMVASDGTTASPPAAYPALRFTRELEQDMVFTVEPGLYFIDSLLESFPHQSLLNKSLIDEFRPFGGIRIEDNILISDAGVRNLTREVFG